MSENALFPNFQNCACCEKYLKDIKKHNNSIWRENMLVVLSFDISCSSQLTVFLEASDAFGNLFISRIMSAGKNFRAYCRAKWRLLFMQKTKLKFAKLQAPF